MGYTHEISPQTSSSTSIVAASGEGYTPSSITLAIRMLVAGRCVADLTNLLAVFLSSSSSSASAPTHRHLALAKLTVEFFRAGWIAEKALVDIVRTLGALVCHPLGRAGGVVKVFCVVLGGVGREVERGGGGGGGARGGSGGGGRGGGGGVVERVFGRVGKLIEEGGKGIVGEDAEELRLLLALRKNRWITAARDSGFVSEPVGVAGEEVVGDVSSLS
ncbi:hypothetical protein HDU67_004487 [Dinochytrium kinnereticum]|nr:hypothetical protein HDU67_004487 [Dinochytrium kinnereticum]